MTYLEGKYIHRWECRDCGSQLAAGTDIENSRNGGPIEPGPVECLVCVSRPLRYLGVWDDGDFYGSEHYCLKPGHHRAPLPCLHCEERS